MKCNHCHEYAELEWKFCPHCGRTLVDEKLIFWFLKALQTKKIVYSILVFEIAFIGFLSFLMASSSKKLHEKTKLAESILSSKREVTVDWQVFDKVFPLSYVEDNQKLVEFKVSSDSVAKIKAEVFAEGITTTETKIIDVKPEGTRFFLGPEISEQGYKKLGDSQKATVSVKVTLLERDQEPKEIINGRKETFFYAVNDIVWNDNGTNNAKYIVRLANKDKIDIANFIRKASDHMKEVGGVDNSMVGGYADPSVAKETIKQQLQAMFLAISKDYQIRYVMAPFSYDSAEVQKVKSPTEVLATRSGLCIELALLYAAALEHIALKPVIVVTSDHAWPGVEINGAQNEYLFIESTMLESAPEEALVQGMENWESVTSQPGGYKILKVTELRSEGLLPMKY